jgi:hypothetical protein
VADTSNDLSKTKGKALNILKIWKQDEPRVLIFHDIRPVTYNDIGKILVYLQEQGFTLVDFDPKRIPNQVGAAPPAQAMSGIAHSPVDLRIIDPCGLILSKEENQIPDALYEEMDIDEDGKLDDFFIIPESKAGLYSIQVIPEANSLPEDTYSLEVSHGEELIVLAENTPIAGISQQPYLITLTEEGMLTIGPDLNYDKLVNFLDFAIFASYWLNPNCEQTNNWCHETNLALSGRVDIMDLAVLAEHWLEGAQ